MTTTEAKIAAALNGHLAELVLDPVLEIAWPNLTFAPAAAAYLRVDNLRNATDRILIANDAPHRQQGIYQVTVMSPIDEGEVDPLEIGGLVADHFAAGTRLAFDGGQVRIDKRPDVASLRNGAGDRWMVPVSVSWLAFV